MLIKGSIATICTKIYQRVSARCEPVLWASVGGKEIDRLVIVLQDDIADECKRHGLSDDAAELVWGWVCMTMTVDAGRGPEPLTRLRKRAR